MRNQGTWSGSIALQKKIPKFASDVSVMLAALGAKLTVLDYSNSEVKFIEMSVKNFVESKQERLVVINGKILLPAEFARRKPIATFGKIMSRAAMSAGSLTYAFMSERCNDNSNFFISSTAGFKEISGPSSLSKEDMNIRLNTESDLTLRAQLLRHFSEILGEKISQLDFTQESYVIDDTEQPERAKNIPQKHAIYLTQDIVCSISPMFCL